ncbi:MAG: sigma-54 dependent transcriptional regulator [Acidobacteriota bacterium]|nr:sigma-54 dependent transcriptional regulator [Acidobacteriota bacterium]
MSHQGFIHVIDDEPIIQEVLGQLLAAEGYDVEISSSGEEGLAKHAAQTFDLVLLDLLMPGMGGIEALQKILKIDPYATVIIITAFASIESAISAMKLGAYDYIQKPFKNDALLMTVSRALAHRKLQEENTRLREELRRKFSFENIIGKSQRMQKVFELIQAVAPSRSTILIQGESGTGKELVARASHTHSPRSEAPFIVVNSGSLPPDLLESHLFGHVKGAFTGAVALKKGLFEAADQGTLFFDEISSLNIETQAKLLRVLQEREFMRLGGTKTIRVDVRIIAATNTDIEELIAQKTFRKDLFYRLNVIKIELPPLRDRKEDIPLLARHFIDVFSRENDKEVEGISEDALEILDAYHWPGNVRELENLMERAVVLSNVPLITREHLPPFLTADRFEDSGISGDGSLVLKDRLQEYQKKLILTALRKTKGAQNKAAQLLGVKPTTLNEMMKRLHITP